MAFWSSLSPSQRAASFSILLMMLIALMSTHVAQAQPRMKARPIVDEDGDGAADDAASSEEAPPLTPEMMPETPPRPMIEVLLNGDLKNTGLMSAVNMTAPSEKYISDSPVGPQQQSFVIQPRAILQVEGHPSQYRWLPFDGQDRSINAWGGVMNKSVSFWFWTDDEMPQGLCGQKATRNDANRLFVRTYPEDDFIAAHIAANIELHTKSKPGELLKQWVHVGVTFNSNLTRLTLYLNGRLEKQVQGIDSLVCWFSDVNYLFGNNQNAPHSGMAPGARLAWIRMFDAELSREHMMWLYAERITGAAPIGPEFEEVRFDLLNMNATEDAARVQGRTNVTQMVNDAMVKGLAGDQLADYKKTLEEIAAREEKEAQEKEAARVAALTPEQRAAEAKKKAEDEAIAAAQAKEEARLAAMTPSERAIEQQEKALQARLAGMTPEERAIFLAKRKADDEKAHAAALEAERWSKMTPLERTVELRKKQEAEAAQKVAEEEAAKAKNSTTAIDDAVADAETALAEAEAEAAKAEALAAEAEAALSSSGGSSSGKGKDEL